MKSGLGSPAFLRGCRRRFARFGSARWCPSPETPSGRRRLDATSARGARRGRGDCEGLSGVGARPSARPECPGGPVQPGPPGAEPQNPPGRGGEVRSRGARVPGSRTVGFRGGQLPDADSSGRSGGTSAPRPEPMPPSPWLVSALRARAGRPVAGDTRATADVALLAALGRADLVLAALADHSGIHITPGRSCSLSPSPAGPAPASSV
jgi:hypothetical protein